MNNLFRNNYSRYSHNGNYENPYYKTGHDLYNVPESQFYDFLQREGTNIKDYWTGDEYQCFFRRNKDTNQTNDNISIYYPVEFPIHPGSLITSYERTYLILNQEHLENRVYRRSDGLNADVMLNTFNKATGEEISIPCFAYDLTGMTIEESDTMSAISGNVELMTGDNEMSRKLNIDNQFYAMGNWYSITSINFKTGIARIGAVIILRPTNDTEYNLEIQAESSYVQGNGAKIEAIATIDNVPVTNATLEWSSSDNSIATIDEGGNALFVGVGDCVISCYWKEHNITESVYIKVIAEPLPVEWKCEIVGEETIYTGSSSELTAKFYGSDGITEDNTISPVWSLDAPSSISKYVNIVSQSGNTVTVEVSSGSALIGKTFSLKLTDGDERYNATKTITIVSWF